MASKLAWAGLLGAASDVGSDYVKRQRDIEDRKILSAQEQRREEARLVREQAMAKFQHDLGAPERSAARAHQFTREEREAEDKKAEREERKSEREERSKREERQEKRSQESLDIQRKQADKPGELERKLEQIEKSDLSPEEKATAKRNALGATRGNLTEFQGSKLRADLAKLEDAGVDETNIAQVNRLRQQLGEPPLSKKVKTPAKKGILGFGSQDEEVEFTTGSPGGIVSSGGGSEAAAPGLDKYQSMLKQSGGIVEMAGPPQTAPGGYTGNIDLSNRPVIKNKDGSSSTESSISVNIDGKEVLIPTIINGKRVSEREAIDHYEKTGEHMGKFDSVEEANAAAEKLHNRFQVSSGEEGGGPLVAPEQLDKLDTMTVPQLQALKMGLLESGDKAAIQSVEGQALLQRINQLIQQKSQLVR